MLYRSELLPSLSLCALVCAAACLSANPAEALPRASVVSAYTLVAVVQERSFAIDPTTLGRVRSDRQARPYVKRSPLPSPAVDGEVVGYTTNQVIPHCLTLRDLNRARQDLVSDGHTIVPINELSGGLRLFWSQ